MNNDRLKNPFSCVESRHAGGYVTLAEAAEMLGMSKKKAEHLLDKGEFPKPSLVSRRGMTRLWPKIGITAHKEAIMAGRDHTVLTDLQLARQFHAIKPPKKEITGMSALPNKYARKQRIDPRYLGTVKVDGVWG